MTLRILHYSDVENAYDDPEEIARLAGRIDSLRDEETLVVGTGDDTGPGVLSLVEAGAQSLDFFEAVEPDAETLGNHDFDHGVERTRELVYASPQPWVCANVSTSDGEQFGATEGVVPWTVADADGTEVGFVGVTTPATADISAEVEALRFTDPEEAVRDHLPELRDRVDFVVVLAHLSDCESLARLSGVDAVLAGHDHSKGVAWFEGTPVVRTGVNGTHLAEVLVGEDSEAGHSPALDVTHHPVSDAPIHDEVAAALADRVARTGLNEVVATVEEPVYRTEEATFCAESRLGNFVTDAYRWASGADVAVASAGGARTGDPLVGDVRALDLVAIAPFDNQLAVAELDGDRLRETFEQLRIRERYPDAPADYVGHVSGARLRWEDGDLADAIVGGELLDPDRTYTLATSDHLFETDNLLSTFDAEDRVRTCGKQYDAFVEYAKEEGVAPEAEGRVRLE